MDLSGFQQVERMPKGLRSTEISLSVELNGLRLNGRTLREFGGAGMVRILHNPQTRQVALVRAGEEVTDTNVFKLLGGGTIGCTAFLKGIQAQPGRVSAEVIDGMLVFSVPKRQDVAPRARPAVAVASH